MEKEFIDYLVVNGIVADEWTQMKTDNPERAERIIDLFSDVVFEAIMRKACFLERITPNEILCFQCLEDKMVLVGLRSESCDLTVTLLSEITDGKVFTTEKPYTLTRELELFKMTEQGCVITDGELFKQLSLLL